LPKTKAVLQTWYLLSMAGKVIVQIISGDENPLGKLPFSFKSIINSNFLKVRIKSKNIFL
jgi:hypothetical protein